MCAIKCILFIFIITVSVHYVNAVDECPTSSASSAPSRLKTAIICDYDASTRPVVSHQNKTKVYFYIILKYFSYDVSTSTLSIDAWMPTFWKDEHLTWNPEDYENISKIHMDTYEIWTPDLSIFNRASQGGDPTTLGDVKCTVSRRGNVRCVPSIHIDALCVPNLSMYPFDTQRCALRFGSWVHKGEEVDILLLSQNILVTDGVEPNGEWEISNYSTKRIPGNYKCCPNTTYPSVEIKIDLQRLSGAHAASVVIPTIVVIIITFTSMSLSSVNKDRLFLCYANVIVQFMHVQYMSWQVPLKGENIPLLLLFARDSLLLSVFTVVFTLINKKIMQKATAAPPYISLIVSGAVSNPIGQFVLLDDNSVKGIASAKADEDTSSIIVNSGASNTSHTWAVFGKILDLILLIFYCIVYFAMCMNFLP